MNIDVLNIQLVLIMQFIPTVLKLPDNMVVLADMVIPLLFLLIGSSHLSFVEDDIVNFLEDQGLQELSAGFVSEEIEVGHLPSMPDNLLVQLGVKTMGSRLNLRTAATAWLIEERSQVQDSEREQVRPFSDTWEFASRDTVFA